MSWKAVVALLSSILRVISANATGNSAAFGGQRSIQLSYGRLLGSIDETPASGQQALFCCVGWCVTLEELAAQDKAPWNESFAAQILAGLVSGAVAIAVQLLAVRAKDRSELRVGGLMSCLALGRLSPLALRARARNKK
jgi:hypothetical protein